MARTLVDNDCDIIIIIIIIISAVRSVLISVFRWVTVVDDEYT